jgi:lactate permease
VNLLLALLPIIILVASFASKKHNIQIAAGVSLITAIILAFFVWGLPSIDVAGALAKGALTSLEVGLIIFGALAFLSLMHHTNVVSSIEQYLHLLSPDIRVQTIMLAWFFGAFLEGSAGFGIPALMIAPLLFRLGIPAVSSVVLALVANSVPVTFGAIGTPIKVGFNNFSPELIAENVAFLGAIIALFIPLLLLAILTRALQKDYEFFKGGIPFALFSGFVFALPYFYSSYLSIEFPSFVGAITGITLVYIAIKSGLPLTPKSNFVLKDVDFTSRPLPFYKIFLPYVFVIVAFLLTRFYSPQLLIDLPANLGHSLSLSNSGIIFFIIFLVTGVYEKISLVHLFNYAKESLMKVPRVASIIFMIVAMIQLVMVGTNEFRDIISIGTPLLPLISPFVGAFGGFIAGSATVSNLIFANIQATAASTAGFSVALILSLQLLGATAGNMLSISNIVIAQSAVNLKHKEAEIIRGVFPWALLYICLIIIITIVFGTVLR